MPGAAGQKFTQFQVARIKLMAGNSAITNANTGAPLRSPAATIITAWLVPGGGHFLLGRRGRGVIIFLTVLATFAIGLLMHGPMFSPGGNAPELNGVGAISSTMTPTSQGDMLSRLIQYGGFLGDVAAGLPYFVATWSGYSQPDQPGHTPDYGAKLLVAAGLMNVLAMVDAFEIAKREKE